MKCPVCGRENFDTNNFCYNCGYCLNSSLKSLKRMKRDRTSFIAAIILLFIICLGLVGFIGYYGIKYRTLISDHADLQASYDKLQTNFEKLDDLVYIPEDWNYTYHSHLCTAFDHELPCYVMDEATAIERGFTPCPYCID